MYVNEYTKLFYLKTFGVPILYFIVLILLANLHCCSQNYHILCIQDEEMKKDMPDFSCDVVITTFTTRGSFAVMCFQKSNVIRLMTFSSKNLLEVTIKTLVLIYLEYFSYHCLLLSIYCLQRWIQGCCNIQDGALCDNKQWPPAVN